MDVASVEISCEACTFRKEINEMMTSQNTKIPELQHHRRCHNNAADYLANCAMNSKKDTSEFACPAGPCAEGGWEDLRESSTQMMTQPRTSGESSSAFTSADFHLPAAFKMIETDIVDDDEYADIEEAERAALSKSSCGMGSKSGVETEVVGEGELAEIAAIEASYSGAIEQHHGDDGGIQTEIVGDDELSVIDAVLSQSSHVRSPPGNLAGSMPGSTSGPAASSQAVSDKEPSSQEHHGDDGGIQTEIVGDDELSVIDAVLSQSSHIRSPPGNLAGSMPGSTSGAAASSPAVSEKEPSSQMSTGRKSPGRAGSRHRVEDCVVENLETGSSPGSSCKHSAHHDPYTGVECILLDSPLREEKSAGADSESGASCGGHRKPGGASCQASEDDGIERILVESPPATAQQDKRVDDGCGASGGGHRLAADERSSRGGDGSCVLFIDDHEGSANGNRLEGDSGGGSSRGFPIASGDGVGARMMGQMGYTGGGLGSNGQDIQEPIQARPRDGRAGLGGERGHMEHGKGKLMNARPKEVKVGLEGENGRLELDDRQRAVYDACMGGKNVFLTGKGGSGKTFLLKVTYMFPLRAVQSLLPRPVLDFSLSPCCFISAHGFSFHPPPPLQ